MEFWVTDNLILPINTYTHVMAGAQRKAAELIPDLAGDKKR